MVRRRRNKPKQKDQARHAQKRALERYDIDLTQNLREHIKKKISHSRVLFKQSLRVTVRAIVLNREEVPPKWRNKEIPIVWDKSRQQVVTFLPYECLNDWHGEYDD